MKKIALGVAAAFAITGATTAAANPKISIAIQQTAFAVVVGNVSGTLGVDGANTANFTGPFGTFSSVSVQAKSYPQQSVPDILNSTTIDVGTAAIVPQSLNIFVTSIDNAVPAPGLGGNVVFTSFFNLTSMPVGWTITEQAYVDVTNTAFTSPAAGALTLLPGGVALSPPQQQTFNTAVKATGGLYAITEIYTIHAASAGNLQAGIDVQGVPAVPEPETYAMMLAGLGLMGFIARRRKKMAVA